MSSPTPFQTQFPHLPRPREPGSSGGGASLASLAILGGGFLLLGGVVAAVVVWLALSQSGFAAKELWEEHLALVIETSVMPDRERSAVLKEVKRLSRACDPARMSSSQLEEVLTALEAAPVLVLLDVGGIERDIVLASGLSSAEKQRGRRTVSRAARGVHAGKIASDDFYAALPPGHFYPTELAVALSEDEFAEYNLQFSAGSPPASDEDVRAALARLSAMADAAGMPDETWKFDLSDEFAKAVEAALAGTGETERRRDGETERRRDGETETSGIAGILGIVGGSGGKNRSSWRLGALGSSSLRRRISGPFMGAPQGLVSGLDHAPLTQRFTVFGADRMSSGLYTQPQFQPPQFPPSQQQFAAPPRSSGNWIISLMLIGGGVLLLLSLMIVAAVWWAVSSLEGWVVNLGREGMVAVVEESDIPPSEKKEVVREVDRVVAAFKSGQIGQEDLDRLFIGLDDSPVMTYISFYGMKDYYIEDTNLPEDKQAELHLAWKRAAYGMFTGKISTDEFYDSLPYDDHFEHAVETSEKEGNELMLKWIARMKKLADDAGVTDDPPEIDIGDETKKLVDKLLADQ